MADSRRTNRRPFDPPPAAAAVQRGERPWATLKPTAYQEATVSLPVSGEPPLQLKLPGTVVMLLHRLDQLQRLQRDEEVVVFGDGDPVLTYCDAMRPGQTEASLVGAVGIICRCAFRADDEVMIVTNHEADCLREERRRTGTYPLSDLKQERSLQNVASERQQKTAADLQELANPGWTPLSERPVDKEERNAV